MRKHKLILVSSNEELLDELFEEYNKTDEYTCEIVYIDLCSITEEDLESIDLVIDALQSESQCFMHYNDIDLTIYFMLTDDTIEEVLKTYLSKLEEDESV